MDKQTYENRLKNVIPGGAHTYSRGSDQFPSNAPHILTGGKGVQVFDPDGNSYLDYGMGLRSVSLGYAEESINNAAKLAIDAGNNLTRPSMIELEAAERLVDLIDSIDMVKFAKNGSNATSAAVKLARAYTGRTMIARCRQHPFFSFDDWFIGSTPITKGIPSEVIEQTTYFDYNDLNSLRNLVQEFGDNLACVIMEPAATACPHTSFDNRDCCGLENCSRFNSEDNFLKQVQKICNENGIVFILDETITGFRWHEKGAQHVYGVTPDLTTFGKAMANGFSVAALGGKKEIMELGSIDREGMERVFLLSTTHGAEMVGLNAFQATLEFIQSNKVIGHLWRFGSELSALFNRKVKEHSLDSVIGMKGPSVSPYYFVNNNAGQPDFVMRTLFAQEMVRAGVLMPWVSVAYRHDDQALKETEIALDKALPIVTKAVKTGVSDYLYSDPIKPVFRKYN